jgi:protein MPE1
MLNASLYLQSSTNSDQELYTEQQPGGNDMQMLIDSIPHLQAQIAQISAMLQNSSLPIHVRQTAEAQHQQLQMQLMQAQTLAGMLSAQAQMQTQGMAGGIPDFDFSSAGPGAANWPPQPMQTPMIQDTSDGAYQRLPVNNRRRNLKRDRPSEFLEIAEGGNKVSRFME